MMMCIGSVSDFDTIVDVPPLTGEERELETRGLDWLYARGCDDGGLKPLPPVEHHAPYSHGLRFIPDWLADAREQSMPDGFSEDIGRTYSDLGSQARGAQHQVWIATFGSSVLRGRKVDPGEHYCGNFGIHGTVGVWLA